MITPDLSAPIRNALVGNVMIAALVADYKDSKSIFTNRPIPHDATFPCIAISQDIALTDEDGVNYFAPVAIRDILIYGRNDLSSQQRIVYRLGYLIRDLFHRKRHSLIVTGANITDIVARGPSDAPIDDQLTGRMVELTVRLNQVM